MTAGVVSRISDGSITRHTKILLGQNPMRESDRTAGTSYWIPFKVDTQPSC
jgi:hypothetical protein